MFDVTDKRAVDRLAAVVVMLERREATAREALNEEGKRVRGRTIADVKAMSAHDFAQEQLAMESAHARWIEAQSALAAARELATDR